MFTKASHLERKETGKLLRAGKPGLILERSELARQEKRGHCPGGRRGRRIVGDHAFEFGLDPRGYEEVLKNS